MKKDIHPQYTNKATITCDCGRVLITGATLAEMRVDICSACHPFYTGKQKLIDSGGQLEKFRQRLSKVKAARSKKA